MIGFLKTIGKGLLYVILFPVILAGIAVYAVFGLFVFIFQFIKSIVLYFSGRSISGDLDEDISAKEKMGELKPSEDSKDVSLYPSDSVVYGAGYVSPAIDNSDKDKDKGDKSDD